MATSTPEQSETDIDITLSVSFPTYGTAEQRRKTAANVRRILEVNLQRKVDVQIKVGKEWEDVERMDRNASVDAGEPGVQG